METDVSRATSTQQLLVILSVLAEYTGCFAGMRWLWWHMHTTGNVHRKASTRSPPSIQEDEQKRMYDFYLLRSCAVIARYLLILFCHIHPAHCFLNSAWPIYTSHLPECRRRQPEYKYL